MDSLHTKSGDHILEIGYGWDGVMEESLRTNRGIVGLALEGIVSVEIFEAVGENHWLEHFKMIAQCLKTGGKTCIQAIVIAEDPLERYRYNMTLFSSMFFLTEYCPLVRASSPAQQMLA